MRMYDIIKDKRDGKQLSETSINFAVKAFTSGEIPDYQMSALAMAIWFNGMDKQETAALTYAMMNSGEVADLSKFGLKTVDKHSTGGVGDKTSIVVLPIVAACGGICAKMSGRGLGHTGGTVDKLESLPGYKTELDREQFISQVEKVGIALVGQSGNLTPADKKLYALRDVTATVDSIPLIASSIMSKKLAAGAHSIVLDVKTGSGAFMKLEDDARTLARCMVEIGGELQRNVRAIITNMDLPLGYAIGNSLELKEAVDVLQGKGPKDLYDICSCLASNMLGLALGISDDTANVMVADAIESGSAFNKLCEWVEAQGSDRKYLTDTGLLKTAANIVEVRAQMDGYITHMDTEQIGVCACILGAGRTVANAPIDHTTGIVMTAKTGDYIHQNDVIAYLHTNIANVSEVAEKYLLALTISDKPPQTTPLIIDIVK